MSAIELRQLDQAAALGTDAPPSRLALYQLPLASAPAGPELSLRPLASLLRVNEAELRTLLHDWLAGVYVCDTLAQAMALRGELAPGHTLVVAEGHVVDRHSIRFYAADSEQAGLLARRQEIEHLQHDIKAQQLIADEAQAKVVRAEAAWQQASQAIGPARLRVSEITRRLHDVQLEHTRRRQQAEQSGEREARLAEDLADIRAQVEELTAVRLEAEERFEALDEQLADWQTRFSEAEMAGEALHERAEA